MNLDKLNKQELLSLKLALEEENKRLLENKLLHIFPATGPLSRDKYKPHLAFFKAGKTFKQRAFIAANRSGKTEAGAFELACHLTGMYPDWWEGKRFETAINAWAAGKTNESTRDTIQEKLLGNSKFEFGTGLIPKSCFAGNPTNRPGVPGAAQDIFVKHISGGISRCSLKSYQQGWQTFQGTAQHVVWFDEEPDDPQIYDEGMIRTMTTSGIVYSTFTPLNGMSDIVMSFLSEGICPEDGIVDQSKFVAQASWDDVPHLSEHEKDEALRNCLPYQIDARSKGIPTIGEGKIYPVAEDDLLVDTFLIPTYWPRAYGLDPGYKITAAVFGAIDPNTDILYIYDEYYRGQAEPAVHCSAIKSRGSWMYGAIDYAGANSDGTKVIEQYRSEGLNVIQANKAVDAGLLLVYRKMCDGKLKVMKHCQQWLKEFRIYRRDKNGKVVKKHDHLMDACRYLVMSGINAAKLDPELELEETNSVFSYNTDRNPITGY